MGNSVGMKFSIKANWLPSHVVELEGSIYKLVNGFSVCSSFLRLSYMMYKEQKLSSTDSLFEVCALFNRVTKST